MYCKIFIVWSKDLSVIGCYANEDNAQKKAMDNDGAMYTEEKILDMPIGK